MSSATDSSPACAQGSSESTDSPETHRGSLISGALVAALATIVTMTIWEASKQAFFPPRTIWWSHVLTILFAGLLAFSISLGVLKTPRTKILSEETARLMAEAELRAREAAYRQLLGNIPEVVWRADEHGNAVFVSEKILTAFGYTSEDVCREGVSLWFGRMHSEDRERVRSAYAALFQDGKPFNIEYRIQHRDGHWMWWHDRAFVVAEMQGKAYADGLLSDITERKQAEEALNRSEGKYRSIFENAVEGIFQSAPEGWFMNVNPALARMCGYETPEAMIGSVKDIGLQFYVDQRRRDHFRRLLDEKGELRGLESQVYRKDGSLIWISENVRAVRDQDGHLLHYEGTVQDATDRRKAEEDLRLSEERFNKAFRSSPEGITISTLSDGRYLEANDSFLQMMGYERNQLIGKTAVELNMWANPEARSALIRKFQTDHLVREYETSFRNKAGEVRLVQISGEAIELQGQSCLLAITRDITERKQLEQQLRQAQKMEAVGQLAGGIAHDFNNLLNIIIGYSDLLLDGLRSDDPSRKKIQKIHESGQKAAAVTRQLLAFSRQQVLQPTVLNLNNVVAELEGLLRPLIR